MLPVKRSRWDVIGCHTQRLLVLLIVLVQFVSDACKLCQQHACRLYDIWCNQAASIVAALKQPFWQALTIGCQIDEKYDRLHFGRPVQHCAQHSSQQANAAICMQCNQWLSAAPKHLHLVTFLRSIQSAGLNSQSAHQHVLVQHSCSMYCLPCWACNKPQAPAKECATVHKGQ